MEDMAEINEEEEVLGVTIAMMHDLEDEEDRGMVEMEGMIATAAHKEEDMEEMIGVRDMAVVDGMRDGRVEEEDMEGTIRTTVMAAVAIQARVTVAVALMVVCSAFLACSTTTI